MKKYTTKKISGFVILFMILAGILLLILNINLIQAQSENNQSDITTQGDAELAIENIKKIIGEMVELNFSIERINDTLNEAQQIYEAQQLREIRRRGFDYGLVLKYEQEVNGIKENAIKAKDELFSLEKSLESLKEEGVNVSEAEVMIQQIKQEIKDARYEKALELAPKTRDKIAEIEASSTAMNVFYSATKRTISDFFKDNYIPLSIFIVAVVVSYFLFKKRILRFFIERKMKKLELEKGVLKKLIQTTQRQYFEKGEISEGTYNVRTAKFAELIRDIDRQIPLFKEELAKLDLGKKFKKAVEIKNQEEK